MTTYSVNLGINTIARVNDTESAYACFEAAKTIAGFTGQGVFLIWDKTGETVAYYDPED